MRAYNYYNPTPVNLGFPSSGPGAASNLTRGRQSFGSTSQIWRSSANNIGSSGIQDNRMYQYPRTETVTQGFNDQNGSMDVTRTFARTSNFDKGPTTLYSTNPYATWKRLSKPDLSTTGIAAPTTAGGGYNLADTKRGAMFSSQTSLAGYGTAQNRSFSQSPSKPVTQPVQIAVYTSTSARQRNRITPRANNEGLMSYQPAPVPSARPMSALGSAVGINSLMGSRRSSVTSLDVTRPLQVSASHWQPIQSKRGDDPLSGTSVGGGGSGNQVPKSWQVGVYAKDLFPSQDQVKTMAELVSKSLFDPRNMEAKGGQMFRKRQERAAQYTLEGYGRNRSPPREYATVPCTLDALKERAKEHKVEKLANEFIQSGIPLPPHPEDLLSCARDMKKQRENQPYTVFDPNTGQTRVIRATNFEIDLTDEEPCEHNIVTPNVCNMIVRDLKGGRGRGSNMFLKRHEKSTRWITDNTNRREKSFGIVEAIKSGRITEDSLEKSLNKMHQARPERLPSMTSVIKQLTPWEAAAEGIPLESTMKSGAQIMAEAVSKTSLMNEQRRQQQPQRTFNPVIPGGNRNLDLSQSSLNTMSNADSCYMPGSGYSTLERGRDFVTPNINSAASSRPTSTTPFVPPMGAVAMPGLTPGAFEQRNGPTGFRASLQNSSKDARRWRPMNFSSSNLPSAQSNTMISAEL